MLHSKPRKHKTEAKLAVKKIHYRTSLSVCAAENEIKRRTGESEEETDDQACFFLRSQIQSSGTASFLSYFFCLVVCLLNALHSDSLDAAQR